MDIRCELHDWRYPDYAACPHCLDAYKLRTERLEEIIKNLREGK